MTASTILVVDVYYADGSALSACFPLPYCLAVTEGEHIAGLESLRPEDRENDPTEGLCSYLLDMGTVDNHDDWFIKAEKILTLWMDGKPIRIVRSTVNYAKEGDKHRVVLYECGEPSIENAWHVLKHLELQFRTNMFVEAQNGSVREKAKPDWFSPIVNYQAVENPVYEAMKFLVNRTV
jgi:hypothetical protein